LLTAAIVGSFGVLLFVIGGHLAKGSQLLGTQVLLGSVILSAGIANAISANSGLLTALLLGISAPKVAKKFGGSLVDARPFFDTVVSIGIGVLFISIAALVPYDSVLAILWPTLLIAVILIVIVRPVVAAIGTAGSSLTLNERAFVAWMDPRGIVAAATASSVGTSLIAAKVAGAEELLPAAFIIIFATVVVYSLSAAPVAKALNVREGSAVPAGEKAAISEHD
jgi:NhaP-type Na+/H+ or K+/H+ antiporter